VIEPQTPIALRRRWDTPSAVSQLLAVLAVDVQVGMP